MPTTLEQIQYGFDRDSRRTWQKRPLSTTQDQAYQYDALSQVSAAARGSLNLNATAISGVPAAAENWDYDPTGNWRGYNQSANGAITLDQHRVHDRGNRLTQIEDNPHNMILDRAGRMRQLAPDAEGDWNGKLDIIWDAWSRITQVKNNGSVAGEYTYDGLFRRVTREVGSEILHSYYNDQWRPVEERKDAETTASMSYLWGARHRDDLVRRDRAVGGTTLNETRFILMDYFNPVAITDEEGTVTERYAFSAFGIRTILNPDYTVRSSSECAMEFSFQGQFFDTESGLINYGFRFYVPALGSWACKDPIEEAGGTNLYAFSDNRSVNLVDHFGLLAVCPLCKDGKPVTLDFLKSTCCEEEIKWWNGNPYCHLPPGVQEEPPPPRRRGGGGGIIIFNWEFVRLGDSIWRGGLDGGAFEDDNDKAYHCVMACTLTKSHGGTTAQILGGIKEMRDMGFFGAQIVVSSISPAIHDALFYKILPAWLKGHGFDDAVADMEANIIGETCASENCIDCCRRYFPDT